jgi:hypothetical protein
MGQQTGLLLAAALGNGTVIIGDWKLTRAGILTFLPVELTLSAAHLDRRLSGWREDAQRDGAAGNMEHDCT